MLKRFLALGLSAIIALSAFAGCSKDSSGDVATDGDVVTLEWWGDWSGEGEEWMNDMIDAFEAEHQNIKINYTAYPQLIESLSTAVATGSTPDLLFWDRYLTGTYARKGFLYDISEMVTDEELALLTPGGVEEMIIDGGLYGLPMIVDTRGFVYNKTMFDSLDLDAPQTWGDALLSASVITGNTGKPFMVTGEHLGLFALMLQAGGYPINDAGELNYNTDAGLAALNFYKEMLDKNQLLIQSKDVVQSFAQESVAYAPVTSADGNNLKQFMAEGTEYTFIEPPVGPNGDKGAMLGGFGLAIPAASKHAEEALTFIKWWTLNADNSQIFCDLSGEMPANLELLESDEYSNEDHKVFAEILTYARPRPNVIWWDEVEKKIITPYIDLFLEGKASAEDTLINIDKDGNALIKTIVG